jgi:hypothetical protein
MGNNNRDKTLWEGIHTIREVIWASEKMPENWQPAIICPIHKKGDKMQCSNYRGNSLLNICYKVLTNILHRQMVPYAKEILGDYQCGFRKGQSTTDSFFTFSCILENFYELNLELHLLFINFKQAYDSINGTHLYEILKELVIPEKLVNLINIMLQNSNRKMKIQGKLTAAFGIERGWRQGDALSITLFNIVLGKVIRNMETNPNGTIFNRTRQYIAHADDVLVLGRSVSEIEEVVTQSTEAAVSTGLVINKSKTST